MTSMACAISTWKTARWWRPTSSHSIKFIGGDGSLLATLGEAAPAWVRVFETPEGVDSAGGQVWWRFGQRSGRAPGKALAAGRTRRARPVADVSARIPAKRAVENLRTEPSLVPRSIGTPLSKRDGWRNHPGSWCDGQAARTAGARRRARQ